MYSPQLGRFLSEDPLEANPTLLYDNNWFGDALTRMWNLYGYCDNNPVNWADPSGLRVSHACDPCLDAIAAADKSVTVQLPGGTQKKCDINYTCDCESNCGAGMPLTTGPDEFGVISICIPCGYKNIGRLVLPHELTHARQFCAGRSITNCNTCQTLEAEAHAVNCGILHAGKKGAIQRCIVCGIFISCKDTCAKGGTPLNKPAGCTIKELTG